MKVELLTHTPNPEKVIATAAKLCYSSKTPEALIESISDEDAVDFLSKIPTGHGSITEHVYFTFAVSGVSRTLLAQITRHRIGVSFSVRSQRYVEETEPQYRVPDEILNNPDALIAYHESMKASWEKYAELTEILKKVYINSGMKPGAATKKAIENARYVLPNACDTQFIVTMNVRALKHFFELRCCNRSQREIRELAEEMLKICQGVSPILFNDAGAPCVRGNCPEGAMSCGHPKGRVAL